MQALTRGPCLPFFFFFSSSRFSIFPVQRKKGGLGPHKLPFVRLHFLIPAGLRALNPEGQAIFGILLSAGKSCLHLPVPRRFIHSQENVRRLSHSCRQELLCHHPPHGRSRFCAVCHPLLDLPSGSGILPMGSQKPMGGGETFLGEYSALCRSIHRQPKSVPTQI